MNKNGIKEIDDYTCENGIKEIDDYTCVFCCSSAL
jgi:hypothetical protein